MPRFAANISTMFGEWDFLDRIAAAADVGFNAVECQWPYDYDARKLSRALSRHGIPMVLINAPAGDGSLGEIGLAAIPGRETECREGIEHALRYCLDMGCHQVHMLSGRPDANHSLDDCRSALIDNTRYVADLFARHDINVLLEPINTLDVPGYLLNRAGEAVSLIRQIDRINVCLQFDLYHAYRMKDDPLDTLMAYREYISHMQISGFPGRHEPDEGEINYPSIFESIDAVDYVGWIGCEYTPRTKTVDGLGWAASYGIGVQ
ncbi:MAG: TIM barrel protein [Rhodospirillales bacterium]|nr:TIM barrel protein [Rhodospirillales bacterium]